MSCIAEILRDISAAGCSIVAHDGTLKLCGPEAPPEALLSRVREAKAELLALLQNHTQDELLGFSKFWRGMQSKRALQDKQAASVREVFSKQI